jgi:hypothetical protein
MNIILLSIISVLCISLGIFLIVTSNNGKDFNQNLDNIIKNPFPQDQDSIDSYSKVVREYGNSTNYMRLSGLTNLIIGIVLFLIVIYSYFLSDKK